MPGIIKRYVREFEDISKKPSSCRDLEQEFFIQIEGISRSLDFVIFSVICSHLFFNGFMEAINFSAPSAGFPTARFNKLFETLQIFLHAI